MKPEPNSTELPPVSAEDVAEAMGKPSVIYLRLTPLQKDGVKVTADKFGLSVTDYLIRCHELVSSKVPGLRGTQEGGQE